MRQRGFVWLPLLPYLIAGAAIVATVVGGYFYIDRHWATSAGVDKGKAEIQVKWNAAIAAQKAIEESKISEAAVEKESRDEKAKVVYRTITRTVDRYIDRPIYRNACFDDDGLRDANSALRGPRGIAGELADPMPGPNPSRKQGGGGGAAKADRGK